jgi:hypothetical protein
MDFHVFSDEDSLFKYKNTNGYVFYTKSLQPK